MIKLDISEYKKRKERRERRRELLNFGIYGKWSRETLIALSDGDVPSCIHQKYRELQRELDELLDVRLKKRKLGEVISFIEMVGDVKKNIAIYHEIKVRIRDWKADLY